MSTTTKIVLQDAPFWTPITGYSANVLLVGPPGRYEVYIGASEPPGATPGMPVTSLDGAFATSAMAETDVMFARPFGAFAAPSTLSLIKS